MGAGDALNGKAAAGEAAPTKVFVERTKPGLSTSAKENYTPRVRSIDMFSKGAKVNLPKLQFTFPEVDGINNLLDIDVVRVSL
jgi:hypothetical protein